MAKSISEVRVHVITVPDVSPTKAQQDVMDVVCTLTNLLMKDFHRGSGHTTLRHLIADRIIREDTGLGK
jgi:hypothetical protein